jgi:hypothetical protein
MLAELREQAADLLLEGGSLDRQLDGRGRALQSGEMLLQREGPAVVEADHLEDTIAAKQSVVRGRDQRLRAFRYSSIDTGQLRRAHA